MVRPVLHAISRLAVALETSALDPEEIESGTVAFAALMHQYGAMLDARILVALWVASVSIPRAIEKVEAKRKAEEKKKAAALNGASSSAMPAALAVVQG
jgi:hypothetical protein